MHSPRCRAASSSSPAGTAKLFAGAPQTLEQVFALATQSKAPGLRARRFRSTFSIKSALAHRTSRNVIASTRWIGREARRRIRGDERAPGSSRTNPALAGDTIFMARSTMRAASRCSSKVRACSRNDRGACRRSALFVAFTAEEKGLLGSEYFLHAPTVARSALVRTST